MCVLLHYKDKYGIVCEREVEVGCSNNFHVEPEQDRMCVLLHHKNKSGIVHKREVEIGCSNNFHVEREQDRTYVFYTMRTNLELRMKVKLT